MDLRLRTALDASIGWYEDLCALHGVRSALVDGLWIALDPPPPLHSDLVAVEPSVTSGHVLERLAGRTRAGCKDSFATMDFPPDDLQLLFAATWIHRPAAPARPQPAGWSLVTTPAELAEWTARHDTTGVLLPGLLERAHFSILARHDDDGELTGGAVARLGSGAVDVSNVWAAEGTQMDWDELVDAISSRYPARQLVGYERGGELADALAAGFGPVGELQVWVR